MQYFKIYDVANNGFLDNIVCGDRVTANKWCDLLEQSRNTEFVPVRFVNGVQVTTV